MKPLFKLLALLSLSALTLTAHSETNIITKTFPTKPGAKLVMDVDRGSIHIATTGSDRVDVKITRELKNVSAAEAKRVFGEHQIEFTSSETELKITASGPKPWPLSGNPLNRMQVNYEITIPAKFDIDLKTAGGHIDVGDLEGKAEVHTSGGNIDIAVLKGPLKAHTSGGHITIARVADEANIDTSGGNIRADEIDGKLVAHTSGGHITLNKTKGAVQANTSGGNIELKDAFGPVNARTSGGHVSARLNTQPNENCSFKTSGGNVDVSLASDLGFNLDAHTGGGRVSSDFPGDFNKQHTKLVARINSGGPELLLETSGGNVNVRKD
jgi:DUF4097 and DUF4098 domain-containing protein YvlB